MNNKVRKGTDLILNITIDGGGIHSFNDIKGMTVMLSSNLQSVPSHIPTLTSTNQCCDQKIPRYNYELKSLVTSSSNSNVLIEALFPADMQIVGRVYSIWISWIESTDELVVSDKKLTYRLDLKDTIEIVNTIEEADSSKNEIDFTFTFTK